MNENRMKTWRENQAKSGKKRIDIYLTEEAHGVLKGIRQETRESYGDIVERLLDAGSIDKPGIKSLTIEVPEEDHERLRQEYGDGLESHLSQFAQDHAKDLFCSDGGDF